MPDPPSIVDRKYREEAITDEFPYLAAVVMNRFRLRFEESIQNRDHPLAREPVRMCSEAAKIG